jgi:hypothetical protein
LTAAELQHLLRGRFQLVRLQNIVPGYGTRETYRVPNSAWLRSAVTALDISFLFDHLRLRLGYGLHLLADGRKS